MYLTLTQFTPIPSEALCTTAAVHVVPIHACSIVQTWARCTLINIFNIQKNFLIVIEKPCKNKQKTYII